MVDLQTFRKLLTYFVNIGFLLSASASTSYWKADSKQGDTTLLLPITLHLDTVHVYKGSHRLAPFSIPHQTYEAIRFGWRTVVAGPDTQFSAHITGLLTTEGLRPVWTNSLRSGTWHSEWTRLRQITTPLQAEFHSPLYGDGAHPIENEKTYAEESLALLASMAHMPWQGYVLAPIFEIGYTRQAWLVKGEQTPQRMRIDGIPASLVVFTRSDGVTSEVWISDAGRQPLRFKNFRGTWFHRLQ